MPQHHFQRARIKVHDREHALFLLGFSRNFPTKNVDGDTLTHPGMDVGPLLGGRVEIDFLAGLIAGLSTSAHCLAMCGGIAAVIALGSGGKETGSGIRASRLMQAQLARVSLYLVLGVIAGAIGWGLQDSRPPAAFHEVARYLSALVLVAAGFSVMEIPIFGGEAGRLGARLAAPVTKRLHHLHRFGPIGLGLVWGLMPCAMIYLMTFYAGLTGSPVQGGLVMLGFGLGTLPALFSVGLGAGALQRLARALWLRLLAGGALIGLAVWTLLSHGGHAM